MPPVSPWGLSGWNSLILYKPAGREGILGQRPCRPATSSVATKMIRRNCVAPVIAQSGRAAAPSPGRASRARPNLMGWVAPWTPPSGISVDADPSWGRWSGGFFSQKRSHHLASLCFLWPHTSLGFVLWRARWLWWPITLGNDRETEGHMRSIFSFCLWVCPAGVRPAVDGGSCPQARSLERGGHSPRVVQRTGPALAPQLACHL